MRTSPAAWQCGMEGRGAAECLAKRDRERRSRARRSVVSRCRRGPFTALEVRPQRTRRSSEWRRSKRPHRLRRKPHARPAKAERDRTPPWPADQLVLHGMQTCAQPQIQHNEGQDGQADEQDAVFHRAVNELMLGAGFKESHACPELLMSLQASGESGGRLSSLIRRSVM